MWSSFVSLWKNIFNYSGKTGRKDFWLGSIMDIIFMYVLLIPFAAIIYILNLVGLAFLISPIVWSVLYIGACLLPLISLYVRRANDLGMKKFDIFLVAVATPVVGAMVVGAISGGVSTSRGLPWYMRGMLFGFGVYIYVGFIGVVLNMMGALAPVVGIGMLLVVICMFRVAFVAKFKN